MPVTGFPVMLESSLCHLMQGSSLDTYKILSNSSGISTVILKFVASDNLAHELPSSPPRLKSPSKLKRDNERRANHLRKHTKTTNVFSTPHLLTSSECNHQKCPAPESVLTDSGVSDTGTSDRTVHTTNTSTYQHVAVQCQFDNKSPIVTPIDITAALDHSTPDHSTVPYHEVTTIGSSAPASHIPSSDVAMSAVSLSTPESVHSDDSIDYDEIFRTKSDYEQVVRYVQGAYDPLRKRLHDPDRNQNFHRVSRYWKDGLCALVGETDDLLITFFMQPKILGPICVFPDEHGVLERDRPFFDEFQKKKTFHFKDSIYETDLNWARSKALTIVRDNCPL